MALSQACASRLVTPGQYASSSRAPVQQRSSKRAPAASAVTSLQTQFTGTPVASRCPAIPATSSGQISESTRRPLRVEAAKRVSTGKSLVLTSTLIAEAGKEEQVVKLCKGVLAMADEKKKEKKAGIISFECHTDAYEGNVVHFWERYDNFLHMNEFHASPEYTKFLGDVRPLLTTPVQLAAYEYNDGKIGCMLNPIGPKGEGGLDDATGQGGSGGGASYKQTSQTVQQGGIMERDGWGLQAALGLAQGVEKKAGEGKKSAAEELAAAIAKSFRSIFGGKKN